LKLKKKSSLETGDSLILENFQNSEPQVIQLALGGYHFYLFVIMIPAESGFHRAVEKLACSSIDNFFLFQRPWQGMKYVIYNFSKKKFI
jgi:hypothetical protein